MKRINWHNTGDLNVYEYIVLSIVSSAAFLVVMVVIILVCTWLEG